MYKRLRKLAVSLSAAFAIPLLGLAPIASAATSTLTVTPANTQGWIFNGDPLTATPYEFNSTHASIGTGSLYVKPIGSNASDKFIAAKPLGVLTSTVSSIAYDFLIAGNGTAASANQFYLNVYTNLPGSSTSSTFYDCRFDYVPTAGSRTSFTTATFSATDTPTNVASRGGATCPTTLAGMLAGSTISFIALNVGDTSTSDVGLAGYLDKVVVTTTGDVSTYDFEAIGTPAITSPANGSVLTSAQLDKIDWSDVVSAVSYEYQAFSDSAYLVPVYSSGPLGISEIPTPGTPSGNYYVRVRAVDASGNAGAWSNDAASPYLITVSNAPPVVILGGKDACKNGGWVASTSPSFKNQGDCVSYFASKGKANSNPVILSNF